MSHTEHGRTRSVSWGAEGGAKKENIKKIGKWGQVAAIRNWHTVTQRQLYIVIKSNIGVVVVGHDGPRDSVNGLPLTYFGFGSDGRALRMEDIDIGETLFY